MNENYIQISNRSKEKILSNIISPKLDIITTQDPSIHLIQNDDDLSDMIQKMKANKCQVNECNKKDITQQIQTIIKKYNVSKLLYPQNIKELVSIDELKISSSVCFNQQIEEIKKDVFDSDFSIINAAFGVSSHGIICTHSDINARLLSLATPLCIILLDKKNITKSLNTGLDMLDKQYENKTLPSNIVFLAGPSCTADIELTPVFGVHGSQYIEIILY